MLKPRPVECHKYDFGRILLLAGSEEYNGAPFLAAMGAMRAGAGVTTLVLPEKGRKRPGPASLIVKELTGASLFQANHWEQIKPLAEKADAILFGPGVGRGAAYEILASLLVLQKPLVLDADGLRILASHPEILHKGHAPLILTPHAGEMQALMQAFLPLPDRTEATREEGVSALARRLSAVVVLKGAGTLVADETTMTRNTSGGPALATAGTGDVLAGMVTTFAAQMPLVQAARLAVYLHGVAADLYPGAPQSMIADDLPALLPQAMQSLLEKRKS